MSPCPPAGSLYNSVRRVSDSYSAVVPLSGRVSAFTCNAASPHVCLQFAGLPPWSTALHTTGSVSRRVCRRLAPPADSLISGQFDLAYAFAFRLLTSPRPYGHEDKKPHLTTLLHVIRCGFDVVPSRLWKMPLGLGAQPVPSPALAGNMFLYISSLVHTGDSSVYTYVWVSLITHLE